MSVDLLLSALTAVLSLSFAAVVGRRCLERRRPSLLVWTLGLVWYGLSTGAQALGALRGWDPLTYRWWYLAGACYTAAYLGMGSIYQLAPRPVAHGIMLWLGLGSAMVAPLVLLAPLDPALLPAPGEAPTGQAVHEAVRKVTPLFNVFGAAALGIGALWGAVAFRHGRRALANLLIALGTVLPSLATGLTRFGLTETLALGQLLGLLCILGGFVLTLRTPRVQGAGCRGRTLLHPAPCTLHPSFEHRTNATRLRNRCDT